MSADTTVDVTHWGLDIGRELTLREFGPNTAYLECPDPLPVGTELSIDTRQGAHISARVVRVHEAVSGSDLAAGMRISATALEGLGRAWWDEHLSVEDPVIPEPYVAPGDADAGDVGDADGVDGTVQAIVPERTERGVADPGAERAPADGPRPIDARKTAVMSAMEIQAITDSADPEEMAREISADANAETTATDATDTDAADDDAPKKKKKRRRKKK